MDRNNLDRFYADNIGLIHTVARKGYGRLMGIGAAISYEDLVQELSEVFIKAFDGFDESASEFSTYFTVAARRKISKIAEGYELDRIGVKTTRCLSDEIDPNTGKQKWKARKEKIHGGAFSVEELSSWSEDGEGSILETIDSGSATPEEILQARQELGAMLGRLSPLAATMCELTLNPPEFMEREFIAVTAHAEYARSQNIERRGRNSLNVAFVAGVLEKTTDLPVAAIRAAKREIMDLAKRGF